MKKLALTLAAIISLSPVQSFAAFSKDDAGTSTAQFLKLGAGARAAGMGEAFGGISDDSTAIYWNPAGLNQVTERTASLMHAVWLESVNYQWASYAQPVKDIGVFGIGAQYLSFGSLTAIDNTGVDAGSFTPNDLAISFSYARKLKSVDLGANIKYISSQIKSSASAYAADFGAMYKLMNNRLSLGCAVQNIGTAMKFQSQEDTLPLNVKIGSAYFIKPQWLVALDINAPVDNEISYSAGTEYTYKLNDTMGAAGRAGYNTRPHDTGGLNGLTAGLGLKYLNYVVDYAFLTYGDLGNTHRMSFTLFWGAAKTPVVEQPITPIPVAPVVAPVQPEPPSEVFTPEVKAAVAEIVIVARKINFDSGKVVIRPQDMPGMRRVAQMLKEIKPSKVRVEGYADSIGDPEYNRLMSQKRAQAVKGFLVAEGVAAELLEPIGYGVSRPLADNTTKAGRLENRRVEFVIISANGNEIRPQIRQ